MVKKKIKPQSAKGKGRRLQNWVAEKVSKLTGYPWGADQPIEPRRMGQNGVDLRLESQVRRDFPWSVECKNKETWAIPEAIRQVKADQYPDTDWLLVYKKNNHEEIAILDAEVFFDLLWKAYGIEKPKLRRTK